MQSPSVFSLMSVEASVSAHRMLAREMRLLGCLEAKAINFDVNPMGLTHPSTDQVDPTLSRSWLRIV